MRLLVCLSGGVVPSPSQSLCGSRADSPVWQVRPPFSTDPSWKATGCARVANTVGDAAWSLLDERDPAKGITLTYRGGQECHSTKTNRTFTSVEWGWDGSGMVAVAEGGGGGRQAGAAASFDCG